MREIRGDAKNIRTLLGGSKFTVEGKRAVVEYEPDSEKAEGRR